MKLISIVVPCYNEQENIRNFYQEIMKVFQSLPKDSYELEIIYVDDGSKDKTLPEIRELAKLSPAVKYLSLSRNFGKESALYAGLQHAKGDYTAVMDVDLQDPPELLPVMLRILEEEEYECVATRRSSRKGEPFVRSMFATVFYRLIRSLSNMEIVDGARDYRLMTRKFVNSLLKLQEYNRFSKGLFEWVGFPVKWLEYENRERTGGTTKWSFKKLFIYSLDGIVSFSTVPAVLSGLFGLLFCLVAFLCLAIIFGRALLYGDPVAGWPSMVCIILFIGGIQMFCLGIMGEYMAKTYMEVKRRPVYLCKESNMEAELEAAGNE